MPEDKKIGQIAREVFPQPLSAEKIVEEEKTREAVKTGTPGVRVARTPTVSTAHALEQMPVSSSLPHREKKSATLLAIERILEEELGDMYWQLPPERQKKFRHEGERTAKKIAGLLESIRINAGKILRMIGKWLAMIPHVNRFFLEQAAKIKTDKIVALHKERGNQS